MLILLWELCTFVCDGERNRESVCGEGMGICCPKFKLDSSREVRVKRAASPYPHPKDTHTRQADGFSSRCKEAGFQA